MTEERLIVEPWPMERSEEREIDWDALYADALPRVYNFFRYRVTGGGVRDGADAEDLTSITFEKAWRARHRYRRDRAAFQTWLLTIARNVAVDHLRQARPHERLDAAADEALAAGPDPAQLAEERTRFARLELLLAELPARERDLVALKYGAGLTNRAIARMTGLGESNVGTILHRTVLALRARWPEGER